MTDYCKTCKHDEDIGFCDKCFYNHILEERGIPPTEYEAKPKPITNYGILRAKSVEEMAEFFNGVEAEAIRRAGLFITVGDIQRGKDGWLDWLKQEAEE